MRRAKATVLSAASSVVGICFVAFVLVLSPIDLYRAQPAGVVPITGTARDITGAPLIGIRVQLLNSQGVALATGTTNKEGKYIFQPRSDGNYTVCFDAQGFYRECRYGIDIKATSDRPVARVGGDVVLFPNPLSAQRCTVEGEQRETSQVNAAALNRAGYYYASSYTSTHGCVAWLFGLDPVRHTGAMLDPDGSVHHVSDVEAEANGRRSFEAWYSQGPVRFVGNERGGIIAGVFGGEEYHPDTNLDLLWIAPLKPVSGVQSQLGGFYSNKYSVEGEPNGFDLLVVPRPRDAPVGFLVVYDAVRELSQALGSASLVDGRLRFRVESPPDVVWIVSGTVGPKRAVLTCRPGTPATPLDCFEMFGGYQSGRIVLPRRGSLWHSLPVAPR